ncbi:MAG: hypothetical protein J6B02_04045 [Selenomonadales bacterium]|nr:hypothetical protein [Selenomonadales bacterium]
MKRDKKALDRIISRLSKEWQADGRKAVKRLYALLDKGKKTAEAIDIVRKEYPALFTLPNVQSALTEAAAYGYGIMPSVLTTAEATAWGAALSTSWDGSGMTLSKKLHGADTKMREAITDTIRDQLKRNATWTEAAKALYDGYEHGNVVRPQQLPQYLSAVRYATQGSPEALAEARKVFYNIERLSKSGAPTKSLRAAYSSLVRAAQTGTEEQLEKACYVAVQEKSRYVAQRIIRTELSRAYSDGFNAKIMQDDDVVAVRLRLSTRHPVFDICNLFAEADMYGLGKGVYPKDKMPPVPLHPHCMCRFEEVYAWEVDISKQKNNVKQAGDKWLNGLSDSDRRKVLGIEGDEAWKQGENWQKYMRNWRGTAEPETRLKDVVQEYRPVTLSKDEYPTVYKAGGITCKKVESPQYDMYVSNNVKLKPKELHEMENRLNESRKLLNIKSLDNFPKVHIISNNEIDGALGAYVAVKNEVFFNSEILNRKAYKLTLEQTPNFVSKSRLTTTVHELIHWQDAERYRAKHGEITDAQEYIETLRASHKKKVDKLAAQRYNIGGISSYAGKMYEFEKYDEVYTEYRIKILLEGLK